MIVIRFGASDYDLSLIMGQYLWKTFASKIPEGVEEPNLDEGETVGLVLVGLDVLKGLFIQLDTHLSFNYDKTEYNFDTNQPA